MAQFVGTGTALKIESATPGTFTTIADVLSVKGPTRKVKSISKTKLSSTTHEYRPGLPDPGECTFELWYDPASATHVTLEGLAAAPVEKNWKITYSDAGAADVAFAGFVTEFDPGEAKDDEGVKGTVKLQVTGTIVTTP